MPEEMYSAGKSALRMAGIVLAMAAASAWPALAAPDRIIHGGIILTMNDERPEAEAVAIEDGLISGLGTGEYILGLADEDTEITDLGGRTMIPGFVDAHGHAYLIGIQAVSANLLPPPDGEGSDIASLQRLLGDWVAENSDFIEANGFIIGFGYDDSQLAELRHPTRHDLDEVSQDVPVLIIHQSGHIGVLNTAALELVGYGPDTEEMEGGVIRREDGNQPNGVLEETPFFVSLGPTVASIAPERGVDIFIKGTEMLASFGYTTGQEGRSTPDTAAIMKAAADQGLLEIDVVTYPDVLVDREFILDTVSRDYENRFRVAGAKLTIDGSPQGFTALRDRPYYDPPEQFDRDYSGYAAANADKVNDAVDWAYEHDIQILTHANGEGASDMLIAAIEAAEERHGRKPLRPVLIHGQFERLDQVKKFVELGVFPSLFPMHTFYWGDWHHDRTVGPVMAQHISPTQWYLHEGSMFSTHHDAPVALPDSMRVLDATVTRRSRSNHIIGEDQRVSPAVALKAMTIWPAYQHFEEDRKGSIEVGKLADLVILSDNPLTVDPETIDTLKVEETIKEGETIFRLIE